MVAKKGMFKTSKKGNIGTPAVERIEERYPMFCSVVYFSRKTLPPKRVKGHYWGGDLGLFLGLQNALFSNGMEGALHWRAPGNFCWRGHAPGEKQAKQIAFGLAFQET